MYTVVVSKMLIGMLAAAVGALAVTAGATDEHNRADRDRILLPIGARE